MPGVSIDPRPKVGIGQVAVLNVSTGRTMTRRGFLIDIDTDDILAVLLERYPPLEIVNQILVPAMRHVGDLFGKGEILLPFVLQSAEVMKAAVSRLEPHMERRDGSARGRVLLATVNMDAIGAKDAGTAVSLYEVDERGRELVSRVVRRHEGVSFGETWYESDHSIVAGRGTVIGSVTNSSSGSANEPPPAA